MSIRKFNRILIMVSFVLALIFTAALIWGFIRIIVHIT